MQHENEGVYIRVGKGFENTFGFTGYQIYIFEYLVTFPEKLEKKLRTWFFFKKIFFLNFKLASSDLSKNPAKYLEKESVILKLKQIHYRNI